MGLQDGTAQAMIAVTDMARATEFYEDKLGLRSNGDDDSDGGRTYDFGGGTSLHVFPSSFAKASGATVAALFTDDVEAMAEELAAKGVSPEQYSEGPFPTDEKGIAHMEDEVGFWIKDPDGNVVAIANR